MVNKSILKNGIRVITENIPHAHSVTIGIWVASGSRAEKPTCNGVAHFIEHLMFKGTVRRSALDIAREIDSLGGVLNAFTGREFVCYYAKVLDKYLPKAVDLLTDIFLNSVFNPVEVEKERKVILQEIGLLEDTPDDHIHDIFSQNFWRGHPLGMPIIGTEVSVGGLTRDFIADYKEDAYRAGDIIIAAAGRVDHDELLRLLDGLFSHVTSGMKTAEPSRPLHEKKLCLIEKDLEQVHLCLGTVSLPQNHPKRYEAYLLNTVFGGGMSSRLFQEVREKMGLAYSIYSYTSFHSDTGSLAIYAGTSSDRLAEVVEIILRELRMMKTDPLSHIELEAAKEQLKGNMLLSLESSDNRMTKLAKNEIYFGCYQPLTEIMKGLDLVTSESVMELAGQLIDDRYFTVVLMGRLGGDCPSLADIVI